MTDHLVQKVYGKLIGVNPKFIGWPKIKLTCTVLFIGCIDTIQDTITDAGCWDTA